MLLMVRSMVAVGVLLTLMLSPAHAKPEYFDIDHFMVEGNTLLGPQEVEEILKPFTGKHRVYADVQHAIEALRKRYLVRGYSVVWVTTPEQDLDGGVVTLQVVEAKIGKITIQGNKFFDGANIRASFPALREGEMPRARDISANAQLANESPAKQVDVVLRPGEKQGVVDAVIDVIDVRPLKGFLTLDNTGNPQTGDFRIGAGVQHANLFNRDDVGTFSYVTAPGRENKVGFIAGAIACRYMRGVIPWISSPLIRMSAPVPRRPLRGRSISPAKALFTVRATISCCRASARTRTGLFTGWIIARTRMTARSVILVPPVAGRPRRMSP